MLARWQQEPDIRDALIQGNRIRVVLRNPHDGPFSRKGVELHPVEPRLEDAYIDAVGGMDQRPSPFCLCAAGVGRKSRGAFRKAGPPLGLPLNRQGQAALMRKRMPS